MAEFNHSNTGNTSDSSTASNKTPVNGPSSNGPSNKAEDKSTLMAVLRICRLHNLTQTGAQLIQEANLTEEEIRKLGESSGESDTNISNVLATYKSEGDPDVYDESYRKLTKFIDASLDLYRHELSSLVYPVFVHMYLELVYNGHEDQSIRFIKKFGPEQEDYYQDDIKKLSLVTKKDQMKGNDIVDSFRSTNTQQLFTIRLSRDAHSYLKRHLNENSSSSSQSNIQNIIQEHLYLDVYDGLTRTKQQVESSMGSMMGEASKNANKSKVYYGLLKEPEITNVNIPDDDGDDGDGGDGDKPKKKKSKKDPLLSKKGRNDPNAPPTTRIPLPELRDAEKIDKIAALRETAKRRKLAPDSLPSIVFYTMLNAHYHHNMAAICAEIAEDSSLIAAGFSDSSVRVWPMTPNKLKTMKSSNDLEFIDKEADDVLYRMMDDKKTADMKILRGHNGPVYAVSFSPDRNLLLSASEDSTIRLWSLQTWTNLCVYKGHCFPVWDVKFSPHGYYFASAAHDRTARLWATDSHQPLRLFAGHISDVDCIQFHPNSNYIASGSTDRSVRLWDVLNGQCVRYLTGHKAKIYALAFSNCGRYLASAGVDKMIIFWDMSRGCPVTRLSAHHDVIYTLAFSRDGTILASGGGDDSINLWDVRRLIEEVDHEDLNAINAPAVRTQTESLLLGNYRTKSTNILALHFTRRNLLLSGGIFH